MGYDLLKQLFNYDPESRLTAKEALQHKWFHEDPKPTWKFVPLSLSVAKKKLQRLNSSITPVHSKQLLHSKYLHIVESPKTMLLQ